MVNWRRLDYRSIGRKSKKESLHEQLECIGFELGLEKNIIVIPIVLYIALRVQTWREDLVRWGSRSLLAGE